MNVKFKLPKFEKNSNSKGMAREIVMTTIATTISIILTFGTAHYVDKWQKRIAGREIAMMIIHDIDEDVKKLREIAKREEENNKLAQYVLNHIDEINTIPHDTLINVISYISEGLEFTFDDSKEKIFHSSQDSWNNIDNAQLIDLIQDFFQERRNYQKIFNTVFYFREPISLDGTFDMYLTSPHFNITTNLAHILNQKLRDEKVLLFINYSFARLRVFTSTADSWQRLSDQCKFSMGITDGELAAFIHKKSHSGRPVTERTIYGTWNEVTSKENDIETLEFNKDHTFTHIKVKGYDYSLYSGQLITTLHMKGTWEIVDDSLVRNYAGGDHYSLDATQITYAKEREDSVKDYIKSIKEQFDQFNEKNKHVSAMGRKVNAAYIDRSGNKIELSKTITNDYGQEEKSTSYIVRKR